jgi:hypothetical protein
MGMNAICVVRRREQPSPDELADLDWRIDLTEQIRMTAPGDGPVLSAA